MSWNVHENGRANGQERWTVSNVSAKHGSTVLEREYVKFGSVKTFNIELLEYWEFAKINSSKIKYV
jgi:hypothetical protein